MIYVIREGVFSGSPGILGISPFAVILLTTRLGVPVFRRLSNLSCNRLLTILLTLSGASLIAKGWDIWNGLFMKIDHFLP